MTKKRSLEDSAKLGGHGQQEQQQKEQHQRQLVEALGDENRTLMKRVNALELALEMLKDEKESLGRELTRVSGAAEAEGRRQRQAVEEMSSRRVEAERETSRCRAELERAVEEKARSGWELERLQQALLRAEAGEVTSERELEALRREAEEGVSARRRLREELERRGVELQELEEQKRELEKDLRLRKVTETETKLKEGPDTLNVVRHIASTLVVRKEHNHLQTDPLWEEEQATEAEALRQAVAEAKWARDKARKDLRNLQFELDFLKQDKALSEQTVSALRVQLDGVKEKLGVAQGELERAYSSERENGLRAAELEERLRKSERALEELGRRHEGLSLASLAAEAQARDLKDEVKSIRRDKATSEREAQRLGAEAESLRAELRRAKEELAQRCRVSWERAHEPAKSWETTEELTGSYSWEENGVFTPESESDLLQAMEKNNEHMVVETVKIRRASEELKPKVFERSHGPELGSQPTLGSPPVNTAVPEPTQAAPMVKPRAKLHKTWEEPGWKVDTERTMKQPESEVANPRCVAQELRRQVGGSEQRKREGAVKQGNNLPGERGQERAWSQAPALQRGQQPPQPAPMDNTSERPADSSKMSSGSISHGSPRAKSCTAVTELTEHQSEALGNPMPVSAEVYLV
eukprot:gi/632953194/ref/XP_007892271.1/ PREDICTED: uncharacterized abhydrolase domain-containing protein DDB_G0269086-like [Callorhinchus milii]